MNVKKLGNLTLKEMQDICRTHLCMTNDNERKCPLKYINDENEECIFTGGGIIDLDLNQKLNANGITVCTEHETMNDFLSDVAVQLLNILS